MALSEFPSFASLPLGGVKPTGCVWFCFGARCSFSELPSGVAIVVLLCRPLFSIL